MLAPETALALSAPLRRHSPTLDVDERAAALRVRYFQGGHPAPNAVSWQAAEAVLRGLKQQGSGALVIFLVSGGGSALLEKPISGEISLADLVTTYDKLVLSGASIVEINAIRKHLSAVKGGRLARAAAPAQQVSILISDVPEHRPDALASGPTMPDSSTVEDCYRVAEQHQLGPQLPDAVRRVFTERRLEETPKAGDEAFARSRWWTVLSNALVRQAAAAAAARAGSAVTMDNRCDDWDYAAAGDYLLERLRELRSRPMRRWRSSIGAGTAFWLIATRAQAVSIRLTALSGS